MLIEYHHMQEVKPQNTQSELDNFEKRFRGKADADVVEATTKTSTEPEEPRGDLEQDMLNIMESWFQQMHLSQKNGIYIWIQYMEKETDQTINRGIT